MKTALVHFNHLDDSNLTRWADMRTSRWKPNYGDMLVCAAIIRQIDVPNRVRVGFGGKLSTPVDRAIIRGSTYLHNEFNFEEANKTLDSINAPLAIVGLGAQSPVLDPTFLDDNEGARGFIARLNEKSESISVRGAFTAEVVTRLGGLNIRITGCPSLFYNMTPPKVRVPEMLFYPQRSLGISIHSGLMKNIFCDNPAAALKRHGELAVWSIRNASKVSLFEQGVLSEYDIADNNLEFSKRYEAAVALLKRIDEKEELVPEDMIARMVSVTSIEEWLVKASEMDAIIGFRFHGNMVALLQGKPCFYYTYDSRIKEFCDVYRLPSRDVAEPWVNPVDLMIEHDWEETNAEIEALYGQLRAFYTENGFAVNFRDDDTTETYPAAIALP